MGILKRLDKAADKRIEKAIGKPCPADEVAKKREQKRNDK